MSGKSEDAIGIPQCDSLDAVIISMYAHLHMLQILHTGFGNELTGADVAWRMLVGHFLTSLVEKIMWKCRIFISNVVSSSIGGEIIPIK